VWTGLILAGGQGRRMGGDKATLVLGGRTLLQRTVDLVRAAGGAPLVIGRLRPADEVAGAPQSDETPPGGRPAGPLPALRHGLAHCGTPVAVALACDLPLLTAELLRFLAAEGERFDAVVPRAAGELQVLAAGYGRGCLAPIDRHLAGGGLAIHGFLETVRLKILEEPDLLPFGGPGILMNVNTPSDLASAEAILRARRG